MSKRRQERKLFVENDENIERQLDDDNRNRRRDMNPHETATLSMTICRPGKNDKRPGLPGVVEATVEEVSEVMSIQQPTFT
jgi:hypothetical protein